MFETWPREAIESLFKSLAKTLLKDITVEHEPKPSRRYIRCTRSIISQAVRLANSNISERGFGQADGSISAASDKIM